MAAAGTVDEKIVATMMKRPYFKKAPPKTLDRDMRFQVRSQNLEKMSQSFMLDRR